MLRKPWTEQVNNEEAFRKMGPKMDAFDCAQKELKSSGTHNEEKELLILHS